MTAKYVTAARHLPEITVTTPVTGQLSTGGEDDFYPRAVYISVRDDGTPRTSTVDFGGVLASMEVMEA